MSVGTLLMLRVGDIWRNGVLVDHPDYQLVEFPNLQINDTTVSLIKAGLNPDDQGFLLPMAEHPWHMQCTHSYCVMVALPENRRLIIPCVELIRFYFGSSSGLLSKLFLPPLERKELYSNPRFNKITGLLELDLAEKISGASASDIGRLCLDPVAWRAALHVGSSSLAASLQKQRVYPQAFFPFEGETSLTAVGKWLSFAGQEQSTFIVYSLRSCSHPFPFRSLRYKTPDSQRVGGKGQQKPSVAPSTIRRSVPDSPNQLLVEQDASNRLELKTRLVSDRPRFPDLTRKKVLKRKDAPMEKVADAVTVVGGTAVDHASVGEPGSERRIRPIDLAIVPGLDEKHRLSIPVFLHEAINDLDRLDGLGVELLTQSDDDGWSFPLDVPVDEDGEISPLLFVHDENMRPRLRRVAAFSVKNDQEQVALVLIEAEPPYVKLYPGTDDGIEETTAILECAAHDFLFRPDADGVSVFELLRWVFDDGA